MLPLALALGAALALGHTGIDPAQVNHLRSAWLQGQVHMRNQAYARAEEAYLQALQAGPDADVYSSLGAVYEAQKRPREAEMAYRQALARASEHTRVRLNLGNLLRKEQRFAEAESLLLEVLANDPRPHHSIRELLLFGLPPLGPAGLPAGLWIFHHGHRSGATSRRFLRLG